LTISPSSSVVLFGSGQLKLSYNALRREQLHNWTKPFWGKEQAITALKQTSSSGFPLGNAFFFSSEKKGKMVLVVSIFLGEK
jgi:hypothetical protein